MHNFIKNKNYSYILAFILISIAIELPLIHTGKLVADIDWLFHASRVEQIYLNLKRGVLINFIATNTFQHTGSGYFLFYPYFFLYPWAMLRFIFNPIISFYIWQGIMTFITLVISFYCMKGFSNNRIISFIFAIVYTFNTYRLYLSFSIFGEYIASAFLPLVFYGFYKMFFCPKDNNSVLILSVGMTLLIYSHLVSVIITLEAFILILILYALAGNINIILSKWKNLSESILLTILLCLPICFLFVFDYIGKGITSTKLGIMLNLVQPLTLVISSSADSLINANSLGPFLIVTCLFGWIFLRYIDSNLKFSFSIYLLGLLFLILASSSFPWYLFRHSILGTIQIPYRYLEFSAFFFSIIFAQLCFVLLTKGVNFSERAIVLSIIFIVLFSYWVPVKEIYTEVRDSAPTQFKQIKSVSLPHSVLDKSNYIKQFDYQIPWGETDYYPQKSVADPQNSKSIINGITYANGKKVSEVHASYLPNTIIYKLFLANSKNLDLPCIAYSNTSVKVNGRSTNYKISSRGTVLIPDNKFKPGKNEIEVNFNPGISYYLCIVVTICTWVIILIFMYTKRKYKV